MRLSAASHSTFIGLHMTLVYAAATMCNMGVGCKERPRWLKIGCMLPTKGTPLPPRQ